MAEEFIPIEAPTKRKPGRPKGQVNKNYLTIRYWFDRLEKDLKELTPAQRSRVSINMMQMLMQKARNLSISNEDHQGNDADDASLLRMLEESRKTAPIDATSTHEKKQLGELRPK